MYFDTHAHLDQSEFDDDRPEVIQRAKQEGVQNIICIGTTADTSELCIKIAAENEGIYAAVGIQPNYCAEAIDGDWQRIVDMANHAQVVAIGETGLDRHWDYTPFELQQDYFDRHIELSVQLKKPFIVHMRDCDEEILAALRKAHDQYGPLHAVMHSFVGSEQMAHDCLALGLHISFAGMVTFKKSEELRKVAASIPADRILVETDSPYLSPHPQRGKRNEPAKVIYTANCIADARETSHEAFAQLTTANAKKFFGLEDN